MQTFLPYESFTQSAQCLDRQRLGKQRIEAKQIWNALQPDCTGGWRNHPAVCMWQGCESALALYGQIMCLEWRSRGYQDTQLEFFQERFRNDNTTSFPLWLCNEAFHRSHQSNLLRKMPEHYGQFGWDVPNDLPYVWPAGREPAKQVQKDA